MDGLMLVVLGPVLVLAMGALAAVLGQESREGFCGERDRS